MVIVTLVVDEATHPDVGFERVGSFRYVINDDRWEWSDAVARMHGYAPGSVTPTTELVLSHSTRTTSRPCPS